jgi:hypothetical protein
MILPMQRYSQEGSPSAPSIALLFLVSPCVLRFSGARENEAVQKEKIIIDSSSIYSYVIGNEEGNIGRAAH